MRKRLSVGFKLSATFAAFLLFVGLTELTLRLIGVDTFVENRLFVLNRALDYPEVFYKDRDLFWRLRPSQEISSRFFEGHTFRINSTGLRGDEIDSVKTRRRLLTLGNSCTFGWGLPRKTIFTDQLSWRMGSDVEIINGGIPGYSSFQGEKFYATELAQLKPDLVLVMFGWNDHWSAASQIADKDQQFPSESIIALQNSLGRLHLYRLIKKGWLNALDVDPDSTYDRTAPVYRVGLTDFAANLTAICQRAKAEGTIAVLMTSPIPSLTRYYAKRSQSPMHQVHERYNAVTRTVVRQQQVLLIDLAMEFDKVDDLWDDPANDPIHFNARGHVLAGMIIAREIKRINFDSVGPAAE